MAEVDGTLVRSHGTDPNPRPPGGRMIALMAILAAGALAVTYLGANSATERSAVTAPSLPPTQSTVLTRVVPSPPLADPLDRRVPGFTGTLVMTVATTDGTEIWRWSSGVDGVLQRSIPVPDLYDARPDASGTRVVALRRHGRDETSLQALDETGALSPILFGAQGFAWHASRPTTILFASEHAGDVPLLHAGQWTADGVWFKPAGLLAGYDLLQGNPIPDRLVGYDDDGIVIESRSTVQRIGPEGRVAGSAPGTFVGMSPNGDVAVAIGAVTIIYSGAAMERRSQLSGAYSSIAWTGDRIAATSAERSQVDLIDGAATRSVDVGPIHPTVLTWSADGRFVVVSGHVAEDPILLFIDSASLDTTSIIMTGCPVAATAVD